MYNQESKIFNARVENNSQIGRLTTTIRRKAVTRLFTRWVHDCMLFKASH